MTPCEFSKAAAKRGASRIVGIDEVGRGPLAGPVVAAAVVLHEGFDIAPLRDSKKLTAKRREALTETIRESCTVAIATASVAEIDRLNILQASLLAMRRAVRGLPELPDHLLIDGRFGLDRLNIPQDCIVKGDARSPAIAAASIVAKTHRDALMRRLADRHPGYGWERNMGYPTLEHRDALTRLGATEAHRKSFAPVRLVIEQGAGVCLPSTRKPGTGFRTS